MEEDAIREGPPPIPFAERPLGCNECKKPVAVIYTEIGPEGMSRTAMCSDCPELERRLGGAIGSIDLLGPDSAMREGVATPTEFQADLACGLCGTTMDEVRRGHHLGCSECYVVFENLILADMEARHLLAPQISLLQRPMHLHVGRVPGETTKFAPSSQLLALREALKETLHREDYEQAAWLRDQIKALTDQRGPVSRGDDSGDPSSKEGT
jgi:protein arginine kinase activator